MLRLLALPFLLVFSAYPQTGVVRANGIPVPGATVKATQGEVTLTTLTGDQGQYRLDGFKDGTWTFEVQMFGFDPVGKEITVQGTSNQEWNLTLKTQTAPSAVARSRPAEGARSGTAGPSFGGQRPGFTGRGAGGAGG